MLIENHIAFKTFLYYQHIQKEKEKKNKYPNLNPNHQKITHVSITILFTFLAS